jgi:ribonucrease Y
MNSTFSIISSAVTIIILVVLLTILLIFILWNKRKVKAIVGNFTDYNEFLYKKDMVNKKLESLIREENELEKERQNIKVSKKILNEKNRELENQIENISNLSQDEVLSIFLERIKSKKRKEIEMYIDEYNKELEERKNSIASNILILAMEKISENFSLEKTSFKIKLPSEAFKGKIIGKDGRNKRTFENITGSNLIIDENDYVTVSSFDPVRRELAVRTLNELIQDGRIQPSRIEQIYTQVKENFDNEIPSYAKKAYSILSIYDIPKELDVYIGKLNFRTSFGQNVLDHCIEAGLIAESIAKGLGLDHEIAKRAAFLHDIGKSMDYQGSRDHVIEGAKLIKQYGMSEVILESVSKHHEKDINGTIYLQVTKLADSISATRPGARLEAISDYFKRMENIEEICNKHEGVEKSYAMQSGREIRVIINPKIETDMSMTILSEEISNEIREKIEIPGRITINFIREYRITKNID